MKPIPSILLATLVLAFATPVFSQTITEADEKAARAVADSVLKLSFETFCRDPQAGRPFGLSSPDKLSRLNADHLGEACKAYTIDLVDIRELDAQGKLLNISNVISASKFMCLWFPVVVDENTILSLTIQRSRRANGCGIAWEELSFGGLNTIGKMIHEMQTRYPRSGGFELLYLRLGFEADYVIVRKGVDYRVFYGFIPLDPSMFGSEKSIQHEMIPEAEFIRQLKSYRGGGLLIR